jgi:hypothetical protein
MSRDELSFPAQIKRLGNSYCIPLPKSMARILGVEEGDDVDVTVKAVGRQDPRCGSDKIGDRPRAEVGHYDPGARLQQAREVISCITSARPYINSRTRTHTYTHTFRA